MLGGSVQKPKIELDLSHSVAESLRDFLTQLQATNDVFAGQPVPRELVVDGREVPAIPDTVKNYALAVWEWRRIIANELLENLRTKAPALKGRFRGSFEVLVDGAFASPLQINENTKTVFVTNSQPYSRKLERLLDGRIFKAAEEEAMRKYSQVALIQVVYVELPNPYVNEKGEKMRYPAIRILPR